MINATGNRMTQEIARQSRLASQIGIKQSQVSTGKRIQRASDDPVATSRIAELNRAQTNDAARGRNISLGITLAGQADGELRNVSNLVARAQELAVAGSSSSLSSDSRVTIALELRAIADEIDAASAVKSPTGEALFPNNTANAIRFDDDVAFAPVATRQDIFETGGVAISQIMRDAATAIEAGDMAATGVSLTAIGASVNHVATAQAEIGINAARLDRIQDRAAQRAITVTEERSKLEDTDLTTAIAELNGMTLTLEAAQAAFARINRRTLMDFLT
jgi:flagellar hook-associated protein 3 FlgL